VVKPVALSKARRRAIGQALDAVREACDTEARRARDPVSFVHRFSHPLDQEIIGLLASSMAFGNVTTILSKLEEICAVLGPNPHVAAQDLPWLRRRLSLFRHRLFHGDDVARLLFGAAAVQQAHGSLGRFIESAFAETGSLKSALSAFVRAVRTHGGFDLASARRGPKHILTDPGEGSGAKRLLLFMRWMTRPADGIDLGLFRIPTSVLLCPVDTHIHKLARNLGFVTDKTVRWETAERITQGLAEHCPDDPVRYDFALCHLGMKQGCKEAKVPAVCDGCGIRPVCRHWAPRATTGRARLPAQAVRRS
jgi:uncharacterized protein (TIGR02757 family)